MKQYLIDELRLADYDVIKAFLDKHYAVPDFENLYWIELPEERLTEMQSAHRDCQPFYFALELSPDRLACELLVRSKQQVRCQCIQYADEAQRNWLIRKVDAMIEKLALIA